MAKILGAHKPALISTTFTILTSGSGTYTVPTNVLYLRVRMVGGGGGSATTAQGVQRTLVAREI